MNHGLKELINDVSIKTGDTKAAAERSVRAVIESMRDALKAGKNVSVFGFGTYKVVDRAARTARSPRDGSEIQVPAKKAVKFTAAKALKDALNS